MDSATETLVDHGQHPRNIGTIPNPTYESKLTNPLCNDEIEVNLLVDDLKILDVKFRAQGCAIMTASASLMSVSIIGRTVDEAKRLAKSLREAMLSGEPDPELDQNLSALLAIRAYPMRVKCVTLPWHALLNALAETL